jgi:hypothetical protein
MDTFQQDLFKQNSKWFEPFATAPVNTLKYFQHQYNLYNKSIELSIQWTNDIINAKIKLAKQTADSFERIFK